jgi:predicted HD phosphohydrolase
LDEKVVIACLLHDIAMAGLITADHGYWGAQLIEPYVDEEVSWAVRHHQALRYFPDQSVGYSYPDAYIKVFWKRLPAARLHSTSLRAGAPAQMVHDEQADHDK